MAYIPQVENIDVAAKYGVVADGVTDNAAALMQMRSDCAGLGKPHYNFFFPAGKIAYSNNRWLYNVVSFDLYGGAEGTLFQAIYNGFDDKLQKPVWNGDIWQTGVLTYTGAYTFTTSYQFNTVTAGSNTITCTTISDSLNFTVGNRILLWGFDQTGNGYPPGTRYNEWHIITAINTSTGVITLQESLANNFNSNWWDVPNIVGTGGSSGKPRITLLDRSATDGYIYPRYCGFHNMTFGLPVGGVSGAIAAMLVVCDTLVLSQVTVQGFFFPSENRMTYCNQLRHVANPALGYTAEIDKIGGSLFITDSYFAPVMINGTGFNYVEIINSQLDQSTEICPRKVKISNCILRADLYPDANESPLRYAPASNPIREYLIESNTFNKSSSNTSNFAVDIQSMKSYTITNVSVNTIVIPFISFTDNTFLNTVATMEENVTYMFKSDGSKFGLVTSLTFNPAFNSGQGAFVIAGDWNVAPVAAETWWWPYCASIIDLGGHRNVSAINPFYGDDTTTRRAKERGKINVAKLDFQSFAVIGSDRQMNFYGKILQVEVMVYKAYNGTDTSANLHITNSGFTDIVKINLLLVGRRLLTEFAANGALSGDTLTTGQLDIWQTQLNMFVRDNGNVELTDISAPALPNMEVLITWVE
jgi:hypothetical protein